MYLIVELSFNAYLLDVASGMELQTDFSQLELYGRSISAAGATLLFWRLLVPFRSHLNITKTLLKYLLITIIVFPIVFMAQKKLIDYLVDSSSSEMRRSAEILSVLKYGIAHGFIEIDELSIDEAVLETAEGKMFVVLAGLLIYTSEEELQKLDSKLDVIAEYAATTQKINETQSNYRNYQYASEKIIKKYREYAQIVIEYDNHLSTTRQKSIDIYQQAIRFGLNRWGAYSIKKNNIERQFLEKKNSLTQLIKQLEDDLSICDNTVCIEEKSKPSIAQINLLLGVNSNWNHWCQEVTKNKPFLCNNSNDMVSFKLQKITESFFIDKFGFDRLYSNKMDYLQSKEFYELFMQSLERHNVPLISQLPLTQHRLIIDDINSHISRYYRQKYEEKVTQLMGEVVRPRLTVGQFSLLPSMQLIYQKALGEIYIEALPITLTRQQFLEGVVQPIYNRQQQELSNKLSSDISWFKQGAPYEESGKNSLRNLVIPPVAIAMSLIFGILNLISLLLNIVFLLVKETTIKRWFAFSILIGAFAITPRFNQYVLTDQQAFEHLINNTQEEYQAAVMVGQWVIQIEPIVYYFGNIIRVNVLDDFEFD